MATIGALLMKVAEWFWERVKDFFSWLFPFAMEIWDWLVGKCTGLCVQMFDMAKEYIPDDIAMADFTVLSQWAGFAGWLFSLDTAITLFLGYLVFGGYLGLLWIVKAFIPTISGG